MQNDYLFCVKPSVYYTKGIHRSLLMDVFDRRYFFVPNTLISFIIEHNKKKTQNEILEIYKDIEDKNIAKKVCRPSSTSCPRPICCLILLQIYNLCVLKSKWQQ